ncbi:hypothetical protein QAD02_015658 [Eretmocerus hayati]|uniref:Uncharacterized protein n=1 Tax=Eretmocerus hayati TaxID=131215 RepID=A0ACC2PAI7_9HYME|nr:hypothetical protein QAD02_015658 [Eretmocerus hayati]
MTTQGHSSEQRQLNNEMEVDAPQQNATGQNAPQQEDAPQQDAENVSDHENDFEKGWRVADDIYIPPPPQVFGEYDTTGPRLMITKIVAKDFKSYAGTVVIGPFHKCFSAIVGPNGNGKSNAIDSMLFVFGYRANKIRTKKITELIHNSNEHPNCSSCTVSVHFHQIIDKPGQDYDIVPDSEFVISRTASKDNSSFYELNGKKVQFKQIAQLLRSHCVDLDHNRFLILQGEVEQIALMKPKGQQEGDTGMLEFLEDIIGTTRYKEPLEKLFQRVEALSELREEKLRRLKVVEKARAELEKPMQDAVQYLKAENAIIKQQHKYYQCKRYETSQQVAQVEESKKELDEDHNKLVEEMNNVQKLKEEKTKDFKEKSKKWDKLQHQKDSLTTKFDEMRKKDEALHADSVATNTRRKEHKKMVTAEKSKLEELQRVPAKNAKDIEECERLQEKQIADREKEEAALATLMSGLKEKTEPLIKKRTDLEKELVSRRKKVDETKSAYDIAKSKYELYTSEEQNEKDKLEQLQVSVKTTNERLAEAKKKLSIVEPKIPLTEKSLQQAQRELHELKVRENEVDAQLRNARARFDEQKNMMQQGRSRNHCLNALMKEKREGRIPGIFGRLGDLGAIDAKYDVAISTACGPLDNIVVDNDRTASQCIEFLRKNDIGRATFIPLNKQQKWSAQCRQKIKTPNNVPRLFDLIQVEDERILPAFYFAIRDTLVVDNLDQATAIAYGSTRYRVVTLKGEVIELTGTMSGGGRQMTRGRMGQRVARSEPTQKDIENLQAELDQVYAESTQIKAKQAPLENQITALSTALKDLISDRDMCKVEINELSRQEPNLRKQLEVQKKRAETTRCVPEKVRELELIVEEAEKKYNESSENSKQKENEVKKINQEIEEISGGRVKEQQKKISNLTKSIDKTKGEICRLQVAIKTAERNAKKAEQKIENLEDDIRKCEQKIRDIQAERVTFEEEGKNIMNELKQLNEELSERDELAGQLKAELDKLQSREGKMKALKIDLDQKLHEKNKVLKELQHKLPELTKSIKAMKLQEIPNEENEDLTELTSEELEELDIKTVHEQVVRSKEKLPKEIPNMQIIEQYKEQNDLYLRRSEKLQKITEERNTLRETYNVAVRRRMQEFNAGFTMITGKLKEMYRMITLGGDAELELVDSLDPFSEGIVFSVRPPKKSWKYIQNLSGGEKTLSSLALVFALHHYKPTPAYFMDEIDAALDFKNVSIVASYIKERTKNAQFIVISHRSDMFELADYLVGIYKIYNCSKCAVLDVKKFNSKVGITEPVNNSNNQARPQFFSQPNPVNRPTGGSMEHRIENAHPAQIPATCPDNINREREIPATCPENLLRDGEESNSENQENQDETNINLSLGDLSLPATPVKAPSSATKKRKADKTPTPSSRKAPRRNVEKDLLQVSEILGNSQSSNESPPDDTGATPRRTSRTVKKPKRLEEAASPTSSARKRRKQ